MRANAVLGGQVLEVLEGADHALPTLGGQPGADDQHAVLVIAPGQALPGGPRRGVAAGHGPAGGDQPVQLGGGGRGGRTLAKESRPAAKASRTPGSPGSARATRTWSWAVVSDTPHFHDSHPAQEAWPHDRQPSRRSNSATSVNHRQVAAARWPASVQISASSRSNGNSPGPGGAGCPGGAARGARGAGSGGDMRASVSNMPSTVTAPTDKVACA